MDAPGGPFCRKEHLPKCIDLQKIRFALMYGGGSKAQPVAVPVKPDYNPPKVYIRCVLTGTEAQWTDPYPPCKLITCPLPLNPSGGGNVTVVGGGRMGSKASYTCPTGSRYTGTSPRLCERTGRFNGSDGVCTPRCQNPALLPESANVVYYDGNTMRFKCDLDTEIYTGTDLVCQSGGWYGSLGECIHKDSIVCQIPSVENDIKNTENVGYGEVYRVTCQEGYSSTGTELECLGNGTLFGILGDCVPTPPAGPTRVHEINSTLNDSVPDQGIGHCTYHVPPYLHIIYLSVIVVLCFVILAVVVILRPVTPKDAEQNCKPKCNSEQQANSDLPTTLALLPEDGNGSVRLEVVEDRQNQ